MSAKKIISLKQHFITSIVTVALLTFFICAGISVWVIFKHLDKEYQRDISEESQIVSHNAVPFILAKDTVGLENYLAKLKYITIYNTVHIYHVKDSQVSTVSSYDKDYTGNQGVRQIPSQFNRKDELSTPKITKNIVELIQPIYHNEDIIGYIYVQHDIETYIVLKNKIFTSLAGCILFSLACFIFVAVRLHSKVTQSVTSLVETIQQASTKKVFDLRCDQQETEEMEFLGRNINTLLSRVEKHLKRQDDAEQQMTKLNHELEDKVGQRTEALKESNEELLATLEKLHQFQGQLVESEKMASLGDMVAGVAHEVNTPIGLGVTASSLLSDRMNEIKTDFENKTLKSSQLRRFLADGQDNVDIISRNLTRAADLISSFKKVAVDQSSEEDRTFKVTELIEEVTLTLAPQLKKSPTTLDIDCPQGLRVTSKPGPINQILINLIVNSLIHGFENRDDGIITINITPLSGQLHIHYQDNGKGVEQSVKNKIFDPFITTKRGEGGSGLGLHLVYNLVTQALGGNIQFESEMGKGVSFDIIFPVVFQE